MKKLIQLWKVIRYSLYAPFYNLIEPLFAKARNRSIALLAPQRGDRLLILGCGTGLDLDFLPSGLELHALDASQSMLNRAQRRADALGLRLNLTQGDAQSVNEPDACYDAVILHLILAVVPNAQACLQEAARLLKPGGRVAILDKFLPDDQQASFVRNLMNPIANMVFSDLNLQLGPLIHAAGLERIHDEGAFGGAYRISLLRKV